MIFSKVTKLGRSRIYRNAINHLGIVTKAGVVYWGYTCEDVQLHADIMVHMDIPPDQVAGVFRAIGDRDVLVDITVCGNANWRDVIQKLFPGCPIEMEEIDDLEETFTVYRFYKHEQDMLTTV